MNTVPTHRITVVHRTVTLLEHRERASDLIVERIECADEAGLFTQIERWQAQYKVRFRDIHIFH